MTLNQLKVLVATLTVALIGLCTYDVFIRVKAPVTQLALTQPADPIEQELSECKAQLFAFMKVMVAAFKDTKTEFGKAAAEMIETGPGKKQVEALKGPEGLAECKRRLPS
jgi:hypothetical protein